MRARPLAIDPVTRPPDATVALPGSKSITNRALVAAALAEGQSTVRGILVAEDTLAMIDCLRALGVGVDLDDTARVATVHGTGGRLRSQAPLWVRQSGTTARFVLPLAALAGSGATVDGDEQIRARPQGDLLEALRLLGAELETLSGAGSLPVRVRDGALRGGHVAVAGDVSSQFVSALLLVGPALEEGLTVELTGPVISAPYVSMTVEVMRAFGADVEAADGRLFQVAPGYRSADYVVEPDASAASYFFAAGAAIPGARVTVPGLGPHSLQGDARFVDVLEAMGAEIERRPDAITVSGPDHLVGVEVDMADVSDTAPTLGAIAPLARGTTRVEGIGFIRAKESDRIGAVVQGLLRLGIDASDDPDGFTIVGGTPGSGVIDTHDDHRIAMAFTILGLVAPGVAVADPQCVAKTFPEFFDTVDQLRAAGDAELAVLAIDGPAGSGKSTVARLAAERLGLEYLDTGAMYRAVTLAALQRDMDPDDEDRVAALARHIEIDVSVDGVLVDGEDVTAEIRSEPVNAAVSVVAANPRVRAAMRRQQRAWARRRGGGVMEGRDIGSVVFPSARLKVHVTASIEERARRRAAEAGLPVAETIEALAARDRIDSGRADSPLTEAVGAITLDTTGMSIDQVVLRVTELFAEHGATRR